MFSSINPTGITFPATMANVTDLQTKYSKLAQEYSKVMLMFLFNVNGVKLVVIGIDQAVIGISHLLILDQYASVINDKLP